MSRLGEIKQRLEKAVSERFQAYWTNENIYVPDRPHYTRIECLTSSQDLLLHAEDDITWLISELERLRFALGYYANWSKSRFAQFGEHIEDFGALARQAFGEEKP